MQPRSQPRTHDRIRELPSHGRVCPSRAGIFFSPPIEPISIPYDGTVLHGYGYLYRAGPGTARPW